MTILKKRDELNDEFKRQLLIKMGNKDTKYQISEEDILKHIDQVELSNLVDLTELFLRYNDDLINELCDFLEIFPQEARKKIKLRNLKKYGGVLKFDFKSNAYIKVLLKEIPPPNLDKISSISGKSLPELIARYRPLFIKSETRT